MEKISVVMTTYNGGKYIEQQLKSVLNQTVPPDEIIISDDCSEDNTITVIKDVIGNRSKTVHIIKNKENAGYIKNFRNVILKAAGDYIFLCDQDDVWAPDKIEKTISVIKEKQAWLACTGFKLIDSHGNDINDLHQYKSDPISGYENWSGVIKNIPLKRLVWGNFSPGCTYCFTKEVQRIYQAIENTEISHDFQLLLIAANAGKAVYIDKPLSCYRIHSANTIGMNQKERKRKRHFQPRMVRFLVELSKQNPIQHLLYAKIVLYLRLPKIRSLLIHKFHLNYGFGLK